MKSPAVLLARPCLALFALLALSFAGRAGTARAEAYRYEAGMKVDPFSPLPLVKPSVKGLTRLQEYDLKDFQLVGTLMGSEVSALIMTPDPREGIIAKIGDRIGKNGGSIIAITRKKMVVREPIKNAFGTTGKKFEDTTIELENKNKTKSDVLNPGGASGGISPGGFPGFNPSGAAASMPLAPGWGAGGFGAAGGSSAPSVPAAAPPPSGSLLGGSSGSILSGSGMTGAPQ